MEYHGGQNEPRFEAAMKVHSSRFLTARQHSDQALLGEHKGNQVVDVFFA